MLTKIQPMMKQLRQQPGRTRIILLALVFVLTVVVFLVRHFRPSGGGRQRKSSKKMDANLRSCTDERPSSSLSSSSSRRHKHSSSKHRSKKLDSALPSLYLLCGVHGSGKSTWAKQFVERVRKSAIIVSSDTFRARATGSIDDYSQEKAVEETLLTEVEHQIGLRRTIIVDDCLHSLDPAFRAKLLDLAREKDYNRVIRRFPIKALFARARIDKDIAEGRKRYNPSSLELEQLIVKFDALDAVIKDEGWYEEK